MIQSKKELDFYIKADYMMNRGVFKFSFKQRLKNLLFPDYIMLYLESMRKVSYYSGKKGKGFLYIINKLIFTNLSIKLGLSIGPNVFDYGLVIPHYGTIVVGPSNRIGKYAVLHTSVCITDQYKEIGDGLYCSSGCKLVFKGKLGNNVTVAANSVVTKEIKVDNVLLVSAPAVIKSECFGWYETDEKYTKRIVLVEQLRKKMKLQ